MIKPSYRNNILNAPCSYVIETSKGKRLWYNTWHLIKERKAKINNSTPHPKSTTLYGHKTEQRACKKYCNENIVSSLKSTVMKKTKSKR